MIRKAEESESGQLEPVDEPRPQSAVARDLHSDPEEGDDGDLPIHHVQSDPPPRFEHEEQFSRWLHSHPIHEGEQEYQEARAGLGLSELHKPETTHEDADEEEHSDTAAGGERSTGVDLPRAGEEEPTGSAVSVPAQPQQEEGGGLQS